MRHRLIHLPLLLASLVLLQTPASARPYDIIYVDSFDVTLCSGCGITLAGLDYALLVNTGPSDITLEELRSATFTAESSQPGIKLIAFLNIPNDQIVGAVRPREAMGSIWPGGNEMLLDQLQPGETLRDLSGMQFMAFQISRVHTGDSTSVPMDDDYEGPVDFQVLMSMGGYEARFSLHANVHRGDHQIMFLTATRSLREKAVLGATPVRSTTWGKIKQIYR
jgi:hypothetical protein